MNEADILNLAREGLVTTLVVLGPIIIAALVIGLVVAIFQAVTQLTEPTLTFVPKIIGIALVLVLLGPLMLNRFLSFARASFEQISLVLR